jgi:flagellar biosynthetic protein FliR/type III secretion protein T
VSLDAIGFELKLFAPHLVAVALCAARLMPVVFLCPLFGGAASPTTVKLSLVLAMAMFLHFAAGVGAHLPAADMLDFAQLAAKEIGFGVVLGLVATLPFDAARMGGRFIDLFRGSSAEAALPLAGTKESATGDGLYQMLIAIAAAGVAMPMVLSALFKSFAIVPLGGFVTTEAMVFQVVALVGGAFSVALAVGAPVAGASMTVDCLLGLVSRAAPQMHLQDTGAPLRILAGGAVTWLAIGAIMERLLGLVVDSGSAIELVSHLAR